jgi:hypothetical protein
MQPKADLCDAVPFRMEIDAAAIAALTAAPRFYGPAESFAAGPTGRGRGKKLLGIAKLIAALGRRHRSPADHLGIAALLHHCWKIASAGRSKSHTGLRVKQDRYRVRKTPCKRRRAGPRARLNGCGCVGVAIGHGFIQLSGTPRGHNRVLSTGHSEPSTFTRLAEVNGDADCDRPLTNSCHD